LEQRNFDLVRHRKGNTRCRRSIRRKPSDQKDLDDIVAFDDLRPSAKAWLNATPETHQQRGVIRTNDDLLRWKRLFAGHIESRTQPLPVDVTWHVARCLQIAGTYRHIV